MDSQTQLTLAEIDGPQYFIVPMTRSTFYGLEKKFIRFVISVAHNDLRKVI